MLTERAADLKPWGHPGFHIVADGAFVTDVRPMTERLKVTVVKDGKRLLRQYQPDQRVRLHAAFAQYHAQLADTVAARNIEQPGSGDERIQVVLRQIAPRLELPTQAAIRWLAAHTRCPADVEHLGTADPEYGLPRHLPMSVYTLRRYHGAAPAVLRGLGVPLGASVARFLMVAHSAAAARDLFHGVQAGRRIGDPSELVVVGGLPGSYEDADFADLLHAAGLTSGPAIYALAPRAAQGSPLLRVAAPGQVITVGYLHQITDDPYPHMRVNLTLS